MTLYTKKDVPAWVDEAVQRCRAAFHIGGPEQAVYISLRKRVGKRKVGKGNRVAGDCSTDPRYLRTDLRFYRGIPQDETGLETITHECLHGALAAQDQAVQHIIEELVQAPLRPIARRLWEAGTETTVSRLARGLLPLIHPDGATENPPDADE